MLRSLIGLPLSLLIACGGTSEEVALEEPDLETPALEEQTPAQIPLTFVAGAFEAEFADMDFDERQSLFSEALTVVNSLQPTLIDTYPASGSATYSGLMQLDYNGYMTADRNETYLVASSLGKLSLAVEFLEFNDSDYVTFEATADSFVLNDGTPLEGAYELFWGPGPAQTDEFTGRSEQFVVYMDGSLSAGTTQYSGDANMYFDVFGDDRNYLSGRVSGELQIFDITAPAVGVITGTTSGTVVANKD